MIPLESLTRKLHQNWLGGIVGAVLAVVLGLGLRFAHFGQDVPLGQGWIQWSYDLSFPLRPDIKTDGVVIVYMDDESHRELNQPYGQAWDRTLHAQLIQRLQADQAKVVAMDVLFSEPGSEIANQELAAAMKAHGRVVIGADYVFTGVPGSAPGQTVMYPIDPLREAAKGIGLVQLIKDPDFGVRLQFQRDVEQADPVPSLPWKVAELVGAKVTRAPLQRYRERWLNYYGPAGTIPNVSYHLARRPDGVPTGFFRDKVVFIGAAPTAGFSGEMRDEFRNPYTWWTKRFSSGVEVHATAYLNLVRQDWLRRVPWGIEFIGLLLLGAAAGYGLAMLRVLPATATAAGSAIAIFLVAQFMFWTWRLWCGWLLVVGVQIPAAWLWSVLFNSIRLHIEKKVLEKSLVLHLSPARIKQILKRPELLKPGAENQEVSILFSDIANFTKLTGRMDPGDLFSLLNRYFETALAAIHQTDGTVVKLIGDSIFAVWNAPFIQPDQQERACRAALALRDQLVQFQLREHSLPLRTRLGLHTGFAYVGNVGSATRFDYTAIGDAINLASRLEGLNKYLGTDLLATRDIQKFVEKTVVSRCVGHFRLKGVDRVVEIHELVGAPDKGEESIAWRKTFEDALFHFQRRSFEMAEAGFRQTLQLHPKDGPALFYLQRILELRSKALAEDWAGEIEITEK